MREEFKSDYWKDFQQRYQSTYGWFEKDNGSKLLVMLSKVEDDRLTFMDKTGSKFQANADKGNVFSFLPVQRGCYEVDGDIMVCKRVPARQWKRGICTDNTNLWSMQHKTWLSPSFLTLESMFGEQSQSMLFSFKKTLVGNAVFNNTFALYGNTLYLYENPIGNYNPVNREITLNDELFKQEVVDFLVKHQLPITLEIKA